jgi:membrane protein DedA with SNARE-associated domain
MESITEILFNAAPYVHYISFGLLVLAGLNLPVSEDLVFIVSSSIAATMVPENSAIIFIACFLGAYTSDIMAYGIGRFAAGNLLKNESLKKLPLISSLFSEKKLESLRGYFNRYGTKTLFFGRFIPFGIRNILFMTSGLIRMDIRKFMLVDFAALACTSTVLYSLGYSLGQNYMVIFPYLSRYRIVIMALLVIFIIFFNRRRIIDAFFIKPEETPEPGE